MIFQQARSPGSGRQVLIRLIPVVACLASIAIFFRIQLQTDFHIVFGDRTDGLIQITILEHWWNVIRGKASWNTTFFFYPIKDTLGYNDGYLIFGMIYSCFRALGADQLLSSDLTNMTIKLAGFIAINILLGRFLSMPLWVSALGSTVFTLANNSYVNAYHAQLLTVAFVPIFAILLLEVFGAISSASTKATILWGCALAIFYCLWLLTAFYTAWFSAYLTIIVGIVALPRMTAKERQACAASLVRTASALAIVALVGVGGLLPFLRLYGPTAAETGMHPFLEVLQYSPSLLDAFNVGPGNVVFGTLDTALSERLGPDFPIAGEHVTGLPPMLVLLALIGGVLTLRVEQTSRRVLSAVALATVVSWLLMVHVGRFSVWYVFYHYFPGARAVRVISRYEIVLTVPVILLAMEAMRRLAERRPAVTDRALTLGPLARPILAGLLSVVLVAEQLNTSWPLGLMRPAELDRLVLIQNPPPGCKAFYAVSTRPGPALASSSVDAVYSNNVDAMFIAESIGLPTLNGMASFYPTGWNLTHPEETSYLARIKAYEASKGLDAVCQLNLKTSKWTR